MLGQLTTDYSYSSRHSHNQLMLQLQHQVEFPENSVIAVTDCSYSFNSGQISWRVHYKIGPFWH